MVQFGRINFPDISSFSGSAIGGSNQFLSGEGVDYLINKYLSVGDLEGLVRDGVKGSLSTDRIVRLFDGGVPGGGFISGLSDSYQDDFAVVVREKIGSVIKVEFWNDREVNVVRDGKGRFVSWRFKNG